MKKTKDIIPGLPEIKVLGKSYKITGSNDSKLYGSVCIYEQIIYINSDAGIDHKVETLQHEIFHVLWFELGLHLQSTNEEKIVRLLSSGYFSVIRNNPSFAKLLKGGS